ncbi:unnamed protein product [Bemisia tabaci]|uniref:Uroporphyrinogen-III synthase n=1 Tax=Bemisia tabaci TaxID=7038 RepID=A0A9P0ANB9_BEMTA|nr:unnamed protein product [Bemisia tabaci]
MPSVLLLKAQSDEARSEAEDPYVSTLTHHKFHVRLIHSLDFHFHSLENLAERLNGPKNYSGIVFTSPRCVKAVSEALKLNHLPPGWESRKVFVVSEKTDQLVRSVLNFSSTVGASAGNEESLISVILEEIKPGSKPLLLPIGSLSSHKVHDKLKERGVAVEELEVYKTVPHPALKEQMEEVVKQNIPDVAVFFSPSGISFSKPIMTEAFISKVKFIAIGPTTKRALEDAGLPVASTSAKPNPDCLLDAINSALKEES